MAAAIASLSAGITDRSFHLFDTFEGMPEPTEHDLRASDTAEAVQILRKSNQSEKIWCKASIEDVMANMASTEYPNSRVHYCRGMVVQTLPKHATDQIAILRLDTDSYESTRHELEHLHPRLSPGGVLIIEDHGYWAGARKAVDEYIAASPILLKWIDQTGRIAVKLT